MNRVHCEIATADPRRDVAVRSFNTMFDASVMVSLALCAGLLLDDCLTSESSAATVRWVAVLFGCPCLEVHLPMEC